MPEALEVRVSGKVLVLRNVKSFHNAALYVYAEDVGLVDGSAKRLATQRTECVSHLQGESTTLPFSINFIVHDPRSDYIVRAHISMSGNQEIERGDMVTTQAYPVLIPPDDGEMILHVQKVS